MAKDPIHIKFANQQNPNAGFDIVTLESLHQRSDLNHSPYQLHLVDFFMIIFIEEGEGYHTIDFTDYKCTKGTILTVRKDQLHKFYKSKTLKGFMLLFTNAFLLSYLEKLEAQKSMQLFNELLGVPKLHLSSEEAKNIRELINRIKEEYFNLNDNYTLGIIRSELHILIAKLYRIKSDNKQIINSRKYLNEFIELQNLAERNINTTNKVKDYAKMMGISTKTLNNITRSIINKSGKEFIDEICIKQIKRLLINTELSIKEIAYSSGFEETTNFYKYFKRHTSTTPERFRDKF